MEIFHE